VQFIAALMMIDHHDRNPEPPRFRSGSRLVVPQSTVPQRVAPLPASIRTASTLGP